MKILQFPLTRVTILFILGMLFVHLLKTPAVFVFSALGVFFAALLLSFILAKKTPKYRHVFAITVYCISFGAGIAILTVHNDYLQKGNYIHQVSDSDPTHLLEIVIREKLKSTTKNDRYFAIVKRIDNRECSGKILVNFKKPIQEFEIGRHLKITSKLLKPKKPDNPDQFDYGKYLVNKSVLAQTFVNSDQIKLGGFTRDGFYYANKLRNRMLHNLLKAHFKKEELAVVAALILGQQQDISRDIIHDYQFAGAVHILSVSGLHVGLILLFLNFMLSYLPKNKKTSYLKLGIILVSLWGFAVLAGLSPSVIRSVTMFSFVALGTHLRRSTNIYHTLLVSIFLILLFEPSFLFDVGFQLSYLALFFILWLQPILNDLWAPKYKIVNYFWEILTVSFAAQLGTLPLSIYYFHQFPGLFFLTNLIIIPFLSIIMALGVLVLSLAVFNWMPPALLSLLEWNIVVLNKIIGWIASLEAFIFKDIPFNIYMLFSLYLLIMAAILCAQKPNFTRIAIALSMLLLFQGSYFSARWKSQNRKEWLVFHARKSTLIAERNGDKVSIFSNDSIQGNQMLQSYLTANFCNITSMRQLPNTAYFHSKRILLIDSLGLYPKKVNPDILLLRQSPKINMERMLQICRPSLIIADGSNYKSYVALWKATCTKEKIPFHATAEKGFYRLN